MRTLFQTLQDHDSGYLRIVAELWGIELAADAGPAALEQAMHQHTAELSLPEPAQRLLEHLQRAGGQVAWEQLNRQYGPLREMGAGRRDRLKPWREPVSALEMLWYRGLVGRAFSDSPSGPLEFGFVPSDLLPLLPEPDSAAQSPPGAPATVPASFTATSSRAVDDATTVLAELRRSWSEEQLAAVRRRSPTDHPPLEQRLAELRGFLLQPNSLELLLELVGELPVHPDQLKGFLTLSRAEALAWLQRGWIDSAGWNDLARLGRLQVAADEWPNDPVTGRQAALESLAHIPPGQWWSLDATIESVQQRRPDFLRGPGGFDNWYLRRADDGQFVTGFEHWYAVEGAYLRYLLRGPLHWLGGVDLDDDDRSFRIAAHSAALFGVEGLPTVEQPPGEAKVRADGSIQIARSADRSLRYQIARFTYWESAGSGGYRYRLSASALQQAEGQGLTAEHAISVLKQASTAELPAGPLRALERWAAHGVEASLQRELVLEVEDPEVLDRLLEQRSTRRWIQTRLDPQRAVVLEADWPKLAAAALSLGLLIREPRGPDSTLRR